VATRPDTALGDGVDLSQHIRDGAAMAATTLPGGKRKIEFVVRYTSVDTVNNPQKQCTSGDISTCRANGLALVLVHEEGSEAARGSYAAGQADAQQAIDFCRAHGMPANVVVHCAIDFNADGPEIAAYVRGFGDKLGRGRRAAYGGLKPIRYLFDHDLIDFGWQTYAWSGGVWDPRITAAQWSNDHIVADNNVDYDSACALDYGQLGPNWTSTDRDVVMAEVDLTPAAVEAVRTAIMRSRVDNVAPPAVGATVGLEQAARMDYYRTAYLALTAAPQTLAQLASILDQSQANGGGISAIQSTLAGFSGGAVAAGITLAQLAAIYEAAAAEARSMTPAPPAPPAG